MKRVITMILAIAMILSLTACGNSAEKWQEQYDLGVRYLSEGNYEEAIIAFTAAIEIDPKRPEAYLRAGDAYVAMGDYASARDILSKGYEETGDASLLEMMESIETNSDYWSQFLTDNMIKAEEITIGGVPFYELSIEEAVSLLPKSQYGDGIETRGGGEKVYVVAGDYGIYLHVEQMKDMEVLTDLGYFNWSTDNRPVVETGIRGISTNDTMEEVLEKIGVSPKGAQIIASADSNVEIDLSGYWIDKTEEYMGGIDGIDTKCVGLFLENGSSHWGVSCHLYFENNRLIDFRAISVWIN